MASRLNCDLISLLFQESFAFVLREIRSKKVIVKPCIVILNRLMHLCAGSSRFRENLLYSVKQVMPTCSCKDADRTCLYCMEGLQYALCVLLGHGGEEGEGDGFLEPFFGLGAFSGGIAVFCLIIGL